MKIVLINKKNGIRPLEIYSKHLYYISQLNALQFRQNILKFPVPHLITLQNGQPGLHI